MTGLDLISSSLRLIGVLASGETPSANEASDALASLNDMLDSWSTENLLIYSIVREVFQLNPAKQVYTMGTGGDFNTARPVEFSQASILLASSTPNVELPVKVLTQEEYADIAIKALTSTFPTALYGDFSTPMVNINLWPVPTDTSNSLVIYSAKPLTQVAALNMALTFPPGYQRALRYNLAIELAPEYGKSVSQEIAAIAEFSRAAIKRQNSNPTFLKVDSALRARSSVWDWRTGESR